MSALLVRWVKRPNRTINPEASCHLGAASQLAVLERLEKQTPLRKHMLIWSQSLRGLIYGYAFIIKPPTRCPRAGFSFFYPGI